MLKKITVILLALSMVFGVICTDSFAAQEAQSGKCGKNLTWTLDKNGTLTISGKGKMYDYNDDDDDEQGYKAAPWHDYTVKKVIISVGVTSIGSSAFYSCTELKNVVIPDSVKLIEYRAFFGCDGMTSVTIGDGVKTVRDGAFQWCDSLKSVTIPSGVSCIEDGAFGYHWLGIYTSEKIPGFTIYGDAGSVAQKYAKKHGFKFKKALPKTALNSVKWNKNKRILTCTVL